jgi:hypothetical protein
MAPPSPEAFAARFRALSPTRRAAFVADLLSARGWETDRDGRTVTASAGGATRRVVVGTPDADPDVDAVVWVPSRFGSLVPGRPAAPPTDATVVSPADLHERLLYAVDREHAAHLYREHFDAALDGGDRDGSPWRRPRRVAALALLCLLAALGATAVFAGVALDGGQSGDVPGGRPSGVAPTDAAGSTPTAAPRPDVLPGDVRNVSRLARVHERALVGRSVAMRATFRGPRFLTGFDTQRSAYDADDEVVLDVCAESDSRYHVVWRTNFGVVDRSGTNTTYARFADGTAEYRRIRRDGERSFRLARLSDVRNGSATVRSVSGVLLFRYLNATQRRVRTVRDDVDPRYRLVATGRPRGLDHPVRDYRATATVRPDGFVTDLRVSYVHPGTQAPVQVTAEYDTRCETGDPPEWYDEARTATRRQP